MPKPLDPRVEEILKKYHPDPKKAVWDCHGTWVVYHKDLEIVAAKAGIKFSPPQVLESNGAAKSVAVCVTGNLGEVSDWSIGEASPANCKNAYPWAMGEKRARDRVILKLLGIHGLVYSEEEADDFRPSNDTDGISALDVMEEVITTSESTAELAAFMTRLKEVVAKLPDQQQTELRKVYTFKKRALEAFKEAAE